MGLPAQDAVDEGPKPTISICDLPGPQGYVH